MGCIHIFLDVFNTLITPFSEEVDQARAGKKKPKRVHEPQLVFTNKHSQIPVQTPPAAPSNTGRERRPRHHPPLTVQPRPRRPSPARAPQPEPEPEPEPAGGGTELEGVVSAVGVWSLWGRGLTGAWSRWKAWPHQAAVSCGRGQQGAARGRAREQERSRCPPGVPPSVLTPGLSPLSRVSRPEYPLPRCPPPSRVSPFSPNVPPFPMCPPSMGVPHPWVSPPPGVPLFPGCPPSLWRTHRGRAEFAGGWPPVAAASPGLGVTPVLLPTAPGPSPAEKATRGNISPGFIGTIIIIIIIFIIILVESASAGSSGERQ